MFEPEIEQEICTPPLQESGNGAEGAALFRSIANTLCFFPLPKVSAVKYMIAGSHSLLKKHVYYCIPLFEQEKA